MPPHGENVILKGEVTLIGWGCVKFFGYENDVM
jgi:hypothetical protein